MTTDHASRLRYWAGHPAGQAMRAELLSAAREFERLQRISRRNVADNTGGCADDEPQAPTDGWLVKCENCTAEVVLPYNASKTAVNLCPGNGWELHPRRLCPACLPPDVSGSNSTNEVSK